MSHLHPRAHINIDLKIYMCPWMQMGHMGSYNFNGNIPAIAQVPNATHGGMLGDAPAKAGAPIFPGGQQIQQPPAVGPVLAPPPPLMGGMGQGTDPATLQDRATRRRALAIKRRAEKKAKKKKKAAASGKK